MIGELIGTGLLWLFFLGLGLFLLDLTEGPK